MLVLNRRELDSRERAVENASISISSLEKRSFRRARSSADNVMVAGKRTCTSPLFVVGRACPCLLIVKGQGWPSSTNYRSNTFCKAVSKQRLCVCLWWCASPANKKR